MPQELGSKEYAQVKIADLTFAFSNQHLITLLKKRGGQLINGDYAESVKTSNKVWNCMNDDHENFEYKRPVMAFVTFLRQEGYERCCQNVQTKMSFFGKV